MRLRRHLAASAAAALVAGLVPAIGGAAAAAGGDDLVPVRGTIRVVAGEDGQPDRYSVETDSGKLIPLAEGVDADPGARFSGTLVVPGSTTDGALLATGRVVRAQREVRKSVTANSVAVERAFKAAAVRGGYHEDETVNFGAVPVDLEELAAHGASGPLVVGDDGVLRVRWSPTDLGALADLAGYLTERVDLLAHPPGGA